MARSRKPRQGAKAVRHIVPGTACHVEEGGVLPPRSKSSLTDSSVLLRGILLESPVTVRRRKSPGEWSGLGLGFGVLVGIDARRRVWFGLCRGADCSCPAGC